MTGEVRCNGCRHWFDRRCATCPECGKPRPGFNKWLRTASLNNQLYGQQESADREERYARAVGI